MAKELLSGVTKLVAHMSLGSETWTNELFVSMPSGSTVEEGALPFEYFRDYMRGNISNNGFLENITAYEVFQIHEGDTNLPEPPLWQTELHLAGTRNTTYGGAVPLGEPLPKDVCVFVKIPTSGGRAGKQFLRALLYESEVISAEAGRWAFEVGADRFTTARFDTLVASTLGHITPGGDQFTTWHLCVAHLLHVKATDTRPAYATDALNPIAVRPVWNKAHR